MSRLHHSVFALTVFFLSPAILIQSVYFSPATAQESALPEEYLEEYLEEYTEREGYIGPADIAVGSLPEVLFILEKDARRIRQINIVENNWHRPRFLELPFAPERMRISSDKKRLAVVGGGSRGRLLLIDPNTFSIKADVSVGHTPFDVALPRSSELGEKRQIHVANRFDGDISVVEFSENDTAGREIKRLPAGREPIALALSNDEKTLVVVNHLPEDPSLKFDIASKIRLMDTQTGDTKAIRLLAGAMGLRDIVLSPGGRYAFVTGLLGNFEHLTDSVGGGWMNENHLYVIDLETGTSAGSLMIDEFGIGSANPWGVSVSEDRRFLIVAAAGSSDVILINFPRLLEMFNGFTGKPTSQNDWIGSDIGRRVEQAASWKTMMRLPVRMRVPVGLKGVRHAVMTRGAVYATAYFEDALVMIEPVFTEPYEYVSGVLPQDNLEIPRSVDKKYRNKIRPNGTQIRVNVVGKAGPDAERHETRIVQNQNRFVDPEKKEPIPFEMLPDFVLSSGLRFKRRFAWIDKEPDWTPRRYGEMLFHDAVVCEDHWQSCSSCHPDGRADALNWDLLNDGQDNPKNTKSLLLSHETPPAMATGIRKQAETAVRKGFETILMVPCTEEEAEAVDAFLSSMKPIPSPKLAFDRQRPNESGRLNESARRGKRLFNSDRAGCSLCHPEPLFTDMRKHDVGTSTVKESSPFDTPTLIEVWRTAPYLHDGRYSTLRQLIVQGRHFGSQPPCDPAKLEELTDRELDDLIEYVLSL